jgi:hypothetical protein
MTLSARNAAQPNYDLRKTIVFEATHAQKARDALIICRRARLGARATISVASNSGGTHDNASAGIDRSLDDRRIGERHARRRIGG